MATFRRSLTPGATYFFTVNTEKRQPVLTSQAFYTAIKESFRDVMASRPFKIDAFVLLPDHLHCIWTLPDGDSDYATRWSLVKRKVSQATCHLIPTNVSDSKVKRKELGLWQRRFWEHQIRDDKDYRTHIEYIHWNPVKHACVDAVKEWPYSSFHKFVAKGIYPEDWGGMKNSPSFIGKFGE